MKTTSFSLFALALLGAGLPAHAQSPYVGESLNYSRLQFGGPARTQGIAGANVALGADFGNLTSNPAGLGLFTKSEFHFSPGIGLGSADATSTGAAQNQTKNSFHIASAGVVFANRKPDSEESNWRGSGLALGFTRLADYNSAFTYSGQVTDATSFLQRLREPVGTARPGSGVYQNEVDDIQAQSNRGQYYSLNGLAYGAFLTSIRLGGTNTNPADTVVITRELRRSQPATQAETVTRSGSLSQFDIGYGGNYQDRLYIGGAIGIVSSNNKQVRDYTETANTNDLTTSFGTLRLHDEVSTSGTGINARVGLIYRVADAVRLGASVQTPTYIKFNEAYSTSLITQFSRPLLITYNNGTTQSENGSTLSLPDGEYAYALTTPFRANVGSAVTFNKQGFLTVDVEYVGYSQARLSPTPNDVNGTTAGFTDDNQGIRTAYRNTVNLRIGGEARFDIFRARLGYARYGDPYQANVIDRTQNFYTAGLGLRQNSFYLDVAGVYATANQAYSPYTLTSGQQPVVKVDNSRYTTTVTAGFFF